MERRDKENYYLDIAETVAERGTCLRRNFGAIIVNKDQIISTGYVGAPRGRRNPVGNGTSFAAPFMRRPTLSSMLPETILWEARYIW